MRLKPIVPALLASALMAGPAFAQAEGPSQRTLGTTTDGKRIVSMVIYGEDPCPEGKDGEPADNMGKNRSLTWAYGTETGERGHLISSDRKSTSLTTNHS